jgi:hypothetical protein
VPDADNLRAKAAKLIAIAQTTSDRASQLALMDMAADLKTWADSIDGNASQSNGGDGSDD